MQIMRRRESDQSRSVHKELGRAVRFRAGGDGVLQGEVHLRAVLSRRRRSIALIPGGIATTEELDAEGEGMRGCTQVHLSVSAIALRVDEAQNGVGVRSNPEENTARFQQHGALGDDARGDFLGREGVLQRELSLDGVRRLSWSADVLGDRCKQTVRL